MCRMRTSWAGCNGIVWFLCLTETIATNISVCAMNPNMTNYAGKLFWCHVFIFYFFHICINRSEFFISNWVIVLFAVILWTRIKCFSSKSVVWLSQRHHILSSDTFNTSLSSTVNNVFYHHATNFWGTCRAANLAKPRSGEIFDRVRSAQMRHDFMTFNAMYLQIKCK